MLSKLQLAVPSGMRLKEAVALEKCLKRSEVRSILDPQDVSHFAVEADEEEGKALRDDEMRVAVVGEVVVYTCCEMSGRGGGGPDDAMGGLCEAE